jgi:hypothetical protein
MAESIVRWFFMIEKHYWAQANRLICRYLSIVWGLSSRLPGPVYMNLYWRNVYFWLIIYSFNNKQRSIHIYMSESWKRPHPISLNHFWRPLYYSIKVFFYENKWNTEADYQEKKKQTTIYRESANKLLPSQPGLLYSPLICSSWTAMMIPFHHSALIIEINKDETTTFHKRGSDTTHWALLWCSCVPWSYSMLLAATLTSIQSCTSNSYRMEPNEPNSCSSLWGKNR